jgi:hypothetical protein
MPIGVGRIVLAGSGKRLTRVLPSRWETGREPPRPTAAWPAVTDKRREADSGSWIWVKRRRSVDVDVDVDVDETVPVDRADDNPGAR